MEYLKNSMFERWLRNSNLKDYEADTNFIFNKMSNVKTLERYLNKLKKDSAIELENRKGRTPLGKELDSILTLRQTIHEGKPFEDIFSEEVLDEFDRIPITIRKNHNRSLGYLNTLEKSEMKDLFVKNFGIDFTYKRIFKRKIDVDYNIKKQNSELSKLNYGWLIQHLSHFEIIEAREFDYSKFLKIEFTSNSRINERHPLTLGEMFQVISGIIGSEPVYVDRSVRNDYCGSMFFRMSSYVSEEAKTSLENFIKNHLGIEVSIYRKKDYKLYSLPFGKLAPLYGTLKRNSVFKINCLPIQEIIKNINESKPSSVYRLNKTLGISLQSKVIERKENSKKKIDPIEKQNPHFGKCTRHGAMTRIALWCIRNNKSLEDYSYLVDFYNDGTSKDLKSWDSTTKAKRIKSYYDFAKKVGKPLELNQISQDGKHYKIIDNTETTTQFDSQADLERIKLEKVLRRNYKSYFPCKRQQGAWKENFIKDSIKIVQFLQRKSKNVKVEYKNEAFKNLEKGVTLPRSIFNDLKEYLSLRVRISKILHVLLSLGILSELTVNGYSFSYKGDSTFAKHYIIDLDQLDKLLDSIHTGILRGLRDCQNSINYIVHVCFEGFDSIKKFHYLRGNYLKYGAFRV
jgi:hypothetical protein